MTELRDTVRALLFDTFGTVVDWRTSLIEAFTVFGAHRGLTADWTALVDAWRGAYHPSMDAVRTGAQPWTDLDGLHRASLDMLLPQFGLGSLPEADRAELTLGWHRLAAWPDAVPGLQRLHRRFVLGPLSNGNVSLMIDLARFNGLPWDMVFGADVFGHYKPDPETYLGACRLLSLDPAQVMLCAAHNYDLGAAKALGLRTAFIVRPTEYGPAQQKDLAPTGAWDVAVTSIEALADQLLT
jgi:2-haloacid dehalogenase